MVAASLDFHMLFESLPAPHLVVLPASLTVAATNAAAVQLVGPAAVGQPVGALFGPGAAEALPATWAELQTTTTLLPPHPRPAPGGGPPRLWQTTVTVVPGGPNEPVRYFLCRLLDVTEDLLAREQNQLNRQSYDLLARTTHDCVWDADLLTGAVRRNERFWEITGYAPGPDTLTTAFWLRHVHPDDADRVSRAFEEALAGSASVLTSEFRFRHHNGHWLEMLDRAYIQRDEAGRPIRLLGAMRDVTERRRAERAVQQTAEQFQFLANHLPQLIWMADAAGTIDYANEGWLQYTGLSLAQTQAGGFLQAVHPDDQATVRAHWSYCIATGENPDITFRLRAATGRYRHHLLRAYAQRDAAGQVQRWFGSITNVHDQRVADRRGRRQLVRQLRQFDQLPLHLIIMRGPEHVVEYFSAQARPYLTSDSLGRPAAAAHPSPGPDMLAQFDRVYRTGQRQELKALPIMPLDAPEDVPARYLDCTLQPLRTAAGAIDGVMLLGVDVTEQVQQQQQVQSATAASQRQQEQFRFLVDFVPQMIWITDAEGRSEYLSERWQLYTGLDLEQLRDFEQWSLLLPPEHRALVRDRWQHALATGTYYEVEIKLKGRDGHYRWFLGQAQPMRNAAGQVVRWFGTTTDIDDQKRSQQLLEQKDRQLNRILGQVPALIATLTGPDHVFTFINDTFAQVLGPRVQVGRSIAQALPEVAEQGFVALMDHVYQTGEPHAGHEHVVLLGDHATEPRYFDFVFQLLHEGPDPDRSLLIFAVETTEQVRSRKRANALAAEVHGRDEQLRIMAESLPLITYISNSDMTMRYLSPQWFSYTGQRPDEAYTPTGWATAFHPDDLAAALLTFNDALFGKQVWEHELRLRRHDGQYRWHLSRATPVTNSQGTIVCWYGSSTDIHAHKELAEQLRRSEEEFRFLAESIPQLVWTIEADGQISYVNQRWIEYTGLDLAQLQHLGWSQLVRPDLLEATMAEFRLMLRSGKPFNAENQLRRATDGEYRWLLHRAEPLHDEHGNFVRWFGTSTDVHDQHLLADELRRREEEFRFLAESVPQIVWTADAAGNNEYVNQRWLDYTGFSLTDSTGQMNWARALHPDDLAPMEQRWTHSVRTGEYFEIEYRLLSGTGSYRWFLGQARALRHTPHGPVVRWFGTCTDIHDVKLSQQQLREQNAELTRINQDLDNFVYTASHDLKQPINNMAGIFEELTRTAYFRDPDAIKLISMFEKSLHQIYGTIHDLSELVRVQKLRHEQPAERVDLAQLTREVLSSIGEPLAGRAVVHTDFAAVPAVQFVRPHLQSILYNLVSNALKYAAPSRRPLIRLCTYLAPDTGQPVLEVQDNGLGINLERFGGELFQLFRRFHDHVEGSGLGLYLVNRVVQSYGGRVQVESVVGKGTTFRILFPASALP